MEKLITKITYKEQKGQFIDFMNEFTNLAYVSLNFDEVIICEENHTEKEKENILLISKKISTILNLKVFLRFYKFNKLTNYWLLDKGSLIAEFNSTSFDNIDIAIKKDKPIMYSLKRLSEYLGILPQINELYNSIFCEYLDYYHLEQCKITNYINLFENLGHNQIVKIFSNQELIVITAFKFIPLEN